MTDAAPSRSVRVRLYVDTIRDAGRIFRLAPGVDIRTALKRAALAAVPKVEGWTLRVFTLERTKEGERVTVPLDRLARAAMGGPDFVAALAATLDGSTVDLAVAARGLKRVEQVSARLGSTGS